MADKVRGQGLKRETGGTVLYLYGISRGARPAEAGVTGAGGTWKVEGIECEGLTGWVGRVAEAEFGTNLARKFEDLDWLAAVSMRHQRVLDAISKGQDVLPARLGTIFLSEESLRRDMREHKRELQADLRRIRGSEEWGVKVFRESTARALPAKVRSGKEYLRAKSQLLRVRQRATMDDEVRHFARELDRLGRATAAGGKISGGRRDLQYQISILLKRSDRKKLRQLLERFSTNWKGRRKIECSGPWPPYSFVGQKRMGETGREAQG